MDLIEFIFSSFYKFIGTLIIIGIIGGLLVEIVQEIKRK